MTSIYVEIPDTIPLVYDALNANTGDPRRAEPSAIGYIVGQVAGELARYGASECALALSYETEKK